jgi:hypothetical protein
VGLLVRAAMFVRNGREAIPSIGIDVPRIENLIDRIVVAKLVT